MIDHTTVKITDIVTEELPVHTVTKPLNNTQFWLVVGGLFIVAAAVALGIKLKRQKMQKDKTQKLA